MPLSEQHRFTFFPGAVNTTVTKPLIGVKVSPSIVTSLLPSHVAPAVKKHVSCMLRPLAAATVSEVLKSATTNSFLSSWNSTTCTLRAGYRWYSPSARRRHTT